MRSTLMSARGFSATISRYPAGAQQARHRDQRSRISLVLRGGFREEGPGGAVTMAAGGLLLKSCTVQHEDAFGSDGAVLFSVEFEDDDLRLTHLDADCWRRCSDMAAARIGASLLEGALARDAGAIDTACADLIAASSAEQDRATTPSPWLVRLRQEIATTSLAQIDVAARAREAGVHPAHASRTFRRCYGVSITQHAQAHGVRRAIALMSRPGATLSDVALAAGFYDQSHMSRAFQRVSGRAPGAHRQLVERVIATAG